MQERIDYHATQLRLCAAAGGVLEIQEAGCGEPATFLAAEMLAAPPQDHTARHALRQARRRALTMAAADGADVDRIGHLVVDEVNLITAAHARSLAQIEERGGDVTYRVTR